MLDVLLQKVAVSETNSRWGRQPDDMTAPVLLFGSCGTHCRSSIKRAPTEFFFCREDRPSFCGQPSWHNSNKEEYWLCKGRCKRWFIIALLFWKYLTKGAEVQISELSANIVLHLLAFRLLIANIMEYNINITGCGWPLTGNTGTVG